jgi:hypothetical protein
MAKFGYDIDESALPKPTNNFDPIPAGWYVGSVRTADMKATKTGGEYLNIGYDVEGPTHSGRVVFGKLNLKNANPTAEEIGRAQLGELMRAVGLSKLTDTDQLIGLRCQIKVKVSPARDGYDASNDVSGWKASEGGMSSAPRPQAAQSSQATSNASSAAPPWAK